MHNRTRWRKDENSRIFKLLLHLILSDIWRNIKETFHWLNWMHSWRKARSVWPNFFAILSSTYILHESCKKKVKSFAKQFPYISTYQWTISTIHIFQSIGEKCFNMVSMQSSVHNTAGTNGSCICQNFTNLWSLFS